MRKVELSAIRSTAWSYEDLEAALEPTLDALGWSPGSGDLHVVLMDRREGGRALVFDDLKLARRAALALASKTKVRVSIFEVVGTAGQRFRFRTTAFLATPEGELKDAEGKELDLEGQGGWIGDLEEQAHQVLDAFANFEYGPARIDQRRFTKRKQAKPSSPRVAALLKQLQNSKTYRGIPQEDGRVELQLELAAGGKQRSFCTAAEYEELQRLVGG